MGNLDLAIRFTDNKYATRAEVSKELQTSLIDNIWVTISSYRKQYEKFLDIHNIDSKVFTLCCCDGICQKAFKISEKFHKLSDDISSLNDDETIYRELIENSLTEIMSYVGAINGVTRSIPNYRDLYRNVIHSDNEGDKFVLRYIDTLDKLQSDWKDLRGDALLIAIYQNLTNSNAEFRTTNDSNIANRVLVDRVYTSAPVNLLRQLLTSLYAFLAASDLTNVSKAAICYFYICLIKPFNDHNEEVAMLVAKQYLANHSNWIDSIYLPLEKAFVDNVNISSKLFVESQKYSDVTYFVNYLFDIMTDSIQFTCDSVSVVRGHQMSNEFFQEDEASLKDEIVEEETPEEMSEPQIKPEPNEQPQEEVNYQFSIEESIQKEVINEPKEEKAIITTKVVEEENPQVVKEEVKPNFERKVVNISQPTNEGLAVGALPPVLDEKEAQRLTVHLLELDPSLRKAEAKFYARHCTLGKCYTIQQFKKYNGCVYETARTGMEHLVELGYYRKEQVKNKFVYSPILRRN